MLLRSMMRLGGIEPVLRLPYSRVPSTLPARGTSTSTQGPGGAPPTDNSKTSQPSSDEKNNNGSTRPRSVATPLEKFFSQFSKFQYQPSISPFSEFNRLCKEYNLGKDDPKKKNMRNRFNKAIKKEFDNLYGSDEKDIKNWRRLCHVLKIKPVPDKLRACRDIVLTKHVNLVDLLEYLRVKEGGKEVEIFETEEKLRVYTIAAEKYFPREEARDGGVLRALRRRILDLEYDPPRNQQSNRTIQKPVVQLPTLRAPAERYR